MISLMSLWQKAWLKPLNHSDPTMNCKCSQSTHCQKKKDSQNNTIYLLRKSWASHEWRLLSMISWGETDRTSCKVHVDDMIQILASSILEIVNSCSRRLVGGQDGIEGISDSFSVVLDLMLNFNWNDSKITFFRLFSRWKPARWIVARRKIHLRQLVTSMASKRFYQPQQDSSNMWGISGKRKLISLQWL